MLDDELRVRAQSPDDSDFFGDFLDTERAARSGRGSGVKETEINQNQGRERQSSLAFVEFLDHNNELQLGFSFGQRGDEQGFAPGIVL
jgi:hypothetical protein